MLSEPKKRTPQKKRNRQRQVIWFNPLFSQSVQSNIGKQFIHLIDKNFPKSNALHKIFNRNSCKISYSCMNNMGAIIKQHNAKILKPETQNTEYGCNCRTKTDCPLEGACLTPSLVYKATVNTENERPMHYIGMTEHEFKSRYRNHKLSFKKKYAANTTLSSHIWDLKKNKKQFTIKWSIVKRTKAYKSGQKQCSLCLAEKMCILNADKKSLLNKRSELLAKCRHANKFIAANYKPP